MLALPDGLEMVDPLSSSDARKNLSLLALPVFRNQNRNGTADCLFGSIAKDAFGTPVPVGDNAVEIFAYNRVIAGFDDGCQRTQLLLHELILGQIARYGSVGRDCT